MTRMHSIIFGAAALLLTSSAALAKSFDHSHAAFTEVLNTHVQGSKIDYAALKESPAKLNGYLDTLAAVKKSDYDKWSKHQRMTYLINLYNAATLKLVIDHYPVKSIKNIGWIGWTIGLGYAITTLPTVRSGANRGIQRTLRKRASSKALTIDAPLASLKPKPNSNGPRILDIGAAEGYLGEELALRHNAHVELVDIGNSFRSNLPHHIYDGSNLPFPDENFDAATIYFVLHHADDADQVLREAHRVSTQRVVIVESWARGPLRKRALIIADRLANALRGGRWRDPIHYRTPEEWQHTFEQTGFRLVESRDLGGWFHAKQLFVIEPIHS